MIACALFVVGGWAVIFWPLLAQGQIPVFRDILDTTVPLGQYIGERFREGKLPQWFPYEDLGEPFIGQLNDGTFHPANWLYAILPVAAALRWQLLLGYLAAALGQLLLGRKLGLSLAASALASVVFAFSGYALSMSNNVPYLFGFVSLPWLGLFAAEVFTRDRPGPWVAVLAVCWATIVLAGDSHAALFGGLVVLFVGAVTGRLRRLPLCVLASLLAIGICAAELLPAIALVKGGPRPTWFNDERIRILGSFWSLHPYRLPELLFPGWMPRTTLFLFSDSRYGEGGVWALSIFVGAPVIALAVAGVASRERRGVLAGALALSGLWLALGYQGGLEPALRRVLPFLNVLRFPEKHLALWTFAVSLGSAAGLEHLMKKPRWTMPALLAFLAAGSAAAALVLPADAAQRVWRQFAQAPLHVAALHAAWRHALFATAASLISLAAILALVRERASALALVPVAVFLELWSASGPPLPLAPASVLTGTPRFCAAARQAGAGPDGLRIVNAASRSRPISRMDDPEQWAATTRALLQPDSNAMCGIGIVSAFGVLSNEARLVRRVLGRSHLDLNPALRLYGFGLVIRSQPEDPPTPDETVVDALQISGETTVLGKRPAAPRAYAATPRWVPNEAAALEELQRPGQSLTAAPVLVGAGAPFQGEGPTGTVRIESYQPEHVVLEARMDRPGVVILNDLDARGWTATLDGAPTPIYLANALVRGILAGPGLHRIEMFFQLPGLRAGLAVSAASLLFCLGLIVLTGRRRGRSASGEIALQHAYWARHDRAHFAWQTGNEYIAGTEARLLGSFHAGENERVLEVGCGEGANLRNLAARMGGAQVFAVDFSLPKAVFAARGGWQAACADATRLPFRSDAFDAVLVRDVLHHVQDRQRVLDEARRVLKPGGRLTVIEPNSGNPVIASMAWLIPAERGMLASSAQRALEEARAAGLTDLRIEEHQAFPISRVLLHYRWGAPSLARFALVRVCLRGLERAAAVALPRWLWSYFVLTARRPGPPC
jgi:SAM-dependent methyltransferase